MPQLKPDVPGLSATDRQLIEDAHSRLEKFLQDLGATCSESGAEANCQLCGKEKTASCQGRWPSFFHDFLDIISEHFEAEEKIMRNTLLTPDSNAYFQRHLDAHKQLMRAINTQIAASSALVKQGNISEAIRQFHQQVATFITTHEPVDNAFLTAKHTIK